MFGHPLILQENQKSPEELSLTGDWRNHGEPFQWHISGELERFAVLT
jgi:hypothetical protein